MDYPEILLPKPNNKIISWHDDLRHCYLIRHTPTNKLHQEGTKKIDFELIKIQSDHLRDFSTNLLGIFRPEHVTIRVKGENHEYFNALWIEGSKVDTPQINTNFDLDNLRSCFFLKISDIEGRIANYSNDIVAPIAAKCKVIHTPTNCNFWHFSIRWFTIDGNQEIDKSEINKSQQKKLLSSAKAIISELAFADEPLHTILSEAHYIKI